MKRTLLHIAMNAIIVYAMALSTHRDSMVPILTLVIGGAMLTAWDIFYIKVIKEDKHND